MTFKEFSIAISPEYPGLEHEKMEFNLDKKAELVKANEEFKKQQIDKSPSPLREFRALYNLPKDSPIKKEFKSMKLREKRDPDEEFVIDLHKMGSPKKNSKTGSPHKTVSHIK